MSNHLLKGNFSLYPFPVVIGSLLPMEFFTLLSSINVYKTVIPFF